MHINVTLRSVVLSRLDKQIMRNEQQRQRKNQLVLQSCQSCKQKKIGGKDSQIVPDLLMADHTTT